ncbi:hypothetical protein PORY_000440 [Pneumocystis oryctolagi]|uniref:Uncharacterized protein n=1 Tax=Pneumocystis oryctolagi TaxID=42067 RepID=A0ACB7CF90_9ASCO|nr:hypothetical protein PORY_000440 [Pneumocystis oryctolagi]
MYPINNINKVVPGDFCLSGIIATLGPRTDTVEAISKLRNAGVNIFRLNFSHGSYEYHLSVIRNLREVERRFPGRPLAIALDTKGPEIRTGNTVCDKNIHVETGHEMLISTDPQFMNKCSDQVMYVDYSGICSVMEKGGIIYVDDGVLSLQVLEIIDSQTLKVVCLNSGMISSRKGVNLPGTEVNLPALSQKDTEDIQFGIKNGVDMIFVSFIRSGKDIVAIKKVLGCASDTIKVIAKVENKQGIDNFDEILKEADGIMVARGDMGIEIPQTQVFIVQRMMISKCNLAGKPCICATQMLEHMINNPRPTRAEISDISTAVLDGVDCCMLSGETAKGLYPVESVTIMRETILLAESVMRYEFFFNELRQLTSKSMSVTESVCCAAVELQHRHSAKAIIVLSSTFGFSAHLCSKYRPRVPIVMVTSNEAVARFSNLYRGIYPLLYFAPQSKTSESFQEKIKFKIGWTIESLLKLGMIKIGDSVVIMLNCCDKIDNSDTIRLHKVTQGSHSSIDLFI